MKNCVFCHRPVPDYCYVLISGHLSGNEFRVEDETEFVCQECVDNAGKPKPTLDGIEVGAVVLLKEHT